MAYNRFTLSALFILTLGFNGLFAQNMFILEKSGSKSSFKIDNLRKMNFESGNLYVYTGAQADMFVLSNIVTLNFKDISGSTHQKLSKGIPELNIYPNPVKDILHIHTENSFPGAKRIEIFSIDGRLMKSEQTGPVDSYSIPVDDLQSGLYILRISTGHRIKTAPIVKQ